MITDKQWKKLEPLFPKLKRRRDRRGRPWADNRACFEGVLWVLRTGARWRDLPPQYPSGSTCWRRLQDWEEQGALEEIWHSLLSQLDRRGLLRWEETFYGRQFCLGKKRGLAVGKTKRGKSRSLTRAIASARTNQVESNAWKLFWGSDGGAGFGMACREGGSLEGAMQLERAGEIILVELPGAAWRRTNCRDPSNSATLPLRLRSGSLVYWSG